MSCDFYDQNKNKNNNNNNKGPISLAQYFINCCLYLLDEVVLHEFNQSGYKL